jgi:hypothetical protein
MFLVFQPEGWWMRWQEIRRIPIPKRRAVFFMGGGNLLERYNFW